MIKIFDFINKIQINYKKRDLFKERNQLIWIEKLNLWTEKMLNKNENLYLKIRFSK